SLAPSEYTLAVSNVVIPASSACSMIGRASSRLSPHSCVPREGSPKPMQPTMMRETFNPEWPNRLYSMSLSFGYWQVSCALTTGSSLEEKSSMSAQAERHVLCLESIIDAPKP